MSCILKKECSFNNVLCARVIVKKPKASNCCSQTKLTVRSLKMLLLINFSMVVVVPLTFLSHSKYDR